MLRYHVSGLPVVDTAGKLVGIVSEGDFIRRSEIGTEKKRGCGLKFLLGAVRPPITSTNTGAGSPRS
jgi:CBS domain-containing protein